MIRLTAFRLSAFLLILLNSCASYEPQYTVESKNWKEKYQLPASDPKYTFFVVGDAGLPQTFIGRSTLSLLDQKIDETKGKQGVIFLGDNAYPKGIPDTSAPNYDFEVEKLRGQVSILEGFEGDIVFIPGNHDWGHGRESLKREDDLIEEWVGRKKIFLPDWGCSGPEDKELTDSIVLIIVDSQWYMEDWDEQEDFNKDCPSTSRSHFLFRLKDEISKHQDKVILFAMHHPLRSVGPHGGKSGFTQEFFPFTELYDYAYFPMPVIAGLLRRNIGIDQDLTNPRYRNFIRDMYSAASSRENVIFLTGHEHSLQYFAGEDHPHIVSGAAAKRSPVVAGGEALYASGQGGFVEMRFYNDNSIWALFWNGSTGDLDFATEIFPEDTAKGPDFSFYESGEDSIHTTLYDVEEYPRLASRALWGPLNRQLYYDTIAAPVFDLAEQPHNLRVIRKGGGNQTNSLRLENDLGHQYVLRSVRKYGSRVLGGVFKGTFIVELLEDVFTYGHPFGAFVLPPLAEAADIYHTNPRLVYVPKQPGLGQYNRGFGNELYLFEERPDDDRSDVRSFGNSKNIVSTDDVMEELEDSYENVIDTAFMMRSRLFDVMVGDWDRHQDNWRWAGFPNDTMKGGTLWRPIPRDRDHVFADFSGFMVSVLNKTVPRLRQFQTYEKEIDWIKWYGEFPKYFDRRFIGPVQWKIWEEQARYLQENVSDEVIEESIRLMPESAFEYSGEEIIEIMKYRRDHLVEMVREYYELLAKNIDIIGTNDSDYFRVERLNDNETRITHWVLKDDEKHLRYARTFYTDETDEVRIYGMEDDDFFEISGDVKDGIVVRAIGGYGNDSLIDRSKVRGLIDKTRAYDYPGGMDISGSSETRHRLSKRYDINNYEFMDFHRGYGLFLPNFSYGPDFGFTTGISFLRYDYGFKKFPNAGTQKLNFNYAFGNRSMELTYQGIFNNTFNYWGIVAEGTYRGPRFTFNYFGEGNETQTIKDVAREYNHVRQGEIGGALGLRRPFKSDAGFYQVKGFFKRLEIESTPDRYIALVNDSLLSDDDIFDAAEIGGVELQFFYDTRNEKVSPTRGVVADFNLTYNNTLDRVQHSANIGGNLTFFEALDADNDLVWATEVGTEHVIGDYLFFQSAALGGESKLRGYRQGRFRGRTAFWNNNDLRYEFGEIRTYFIPFKIGIIGSFDHGRVWHDELTSRKWHYSYGGGLYLNLVDLVATTFSYNMGDVNGQFRFTLGFNL